jgi:large subunit ribosomal protein L24
MQRIKKGDKVRVISGKNKGKEGIATKIFPKCNCAIVEGLNIVKVHQKPSQKNENKGGIITKEAPINLSKLALVVAKSLRGVSKVSFNINDNGKKVRIAKATKKEVSDK